MKQELIDAVIESLKKDFKQGDYTVLEGILFLIPDDVLISSLPEEEGKNWCLGDLS